MHTGIENKGEDLCCRIEDRAAWEVLMLWDRGELHGRDSCSG